MNAILATSAVFLSAMRNTISAFTALSPQFSMVDRAASFSEPEPPTITRVVLDTMTLPFYQIFDSVAYCVTSIVSSVNDLTEYLITARTDSGYFLYEDVLIGFVGIFAIKFVIDFAIVKRFTKPDEQTLRHFVLHVMFNAWVVWMVASDSVDAFLRPERVLTSNIRDRHASSAVITTAGISSFHLYHLLFFSNLTSEDLTHHFVNTFLVAVIGVALPIGKMISLSNLGMCGLPGGIDYALLILVKRKLIEPITEKRVNRYLNLLIRFPIQMFLAYIVISSHFNGNEAFQQFSYPTLAIIVACSALQLLNCIYYTMKVIENYAIHRKDAEQMEGRRSRRLERREGNTSGYSLKQWGFGETPWGSAPAVQEQSVVQTI